MNEMKIYIAGPMTGYEKYNFPKFDSIEQMLKDNYACEPVNPANIARKYKVKEVLAHKETFNKMICEELDALKTCSHILLLEGWEKSAGALKELRVAIERNIAVILEGNLDKDLRKAKRKWENGR